MSNSGITATHFLAWSIHSYCTCKALSIFMLSSFSWCSGMVVLLEQKSCWTWMPARQPSRPLSLSLAVAWGYSSIQKSSGSIYSRNINEMLHCNKISPQARSTWEWMYNANIILIVFFQCCKNPILCSFWNMSPLVSPSIQADSLQG